MDTISVLNAETGKFESMKAYRLNGTNGKFAVHRKLKDERKWNITHTKTNCSIPFDFETMKKACFIAGMLYTSGINWEKKKGQYTKKDIDKALEICKYGWLSKKG